MSILFISDLHLDASRPDIIHYFIELNNSIARYAEAYYILGDFLEYWIGDDDPAEELATVMDSLRDISNAGVAIFLMHGNRDFLIGEKFAQRCNLTLLPDPSLIDLYGRKTLLMHGDTLCTDDTEYQTFRQHVRSESWQKEFLAKPLRERRAIVNNLRTISREETLKKTDDIMDVNPTEVTRIMQAYNVDQLIHGHTHRPSIHTFELQGQPARRIVLGDWYKKNSYLIVDSNNYILEK